MKELSYFLLSFLILLVHKPTFGQVDSSFVADSLVIKSRYVEGMEYLIKIKLPFDYLTSNHHYSVVYYLDAYAIEHDVTKAYIESDAQQVILVGISHRGNLQDFIKFRTRDFTPTYMSPENIGGVLGQYTPNSGGATKFKDFLEMELIPIVNKKYRTKPKSTGLFGFSYGGLFVSWVLFTQPSLFQKYFIGSPPLFWDNKLIFNCEEKLYRHGKRLPVTVYTSIESDNEVIPNHIENWKLFVKILTERKYKKFVFASEKLEGFDHESALPLAFSNAFRFLYPRKKQESK